MVNLQPLSPMQESSLSARNLPLFSESVATEPVATEPVATEPVAAESIASEEVTLALAEYEATSSIVQIDLALASYSIRIPQFCAKRHCAICEAVFLAQGPTGFVGEKEICDLCLFRGDSQLGMIIALIAITRSFARSPKTTFDHFFQALLELGTFARLYEVFAARFGVPRPFILPGNATWDSPSAES